MVLTEADVKVGKTYRAKRFVQGFSGNNDRYVLWISPDRRKVQYDSDTVRRGRSYPIVGMDVFLRWAKEEVKVEAPACSLSS